MKNPPFFIIEVLSGKLYLKNNTSYIDFKSKIFANDQKLVNTSRKFEFTNRELKYKLWMSIKNNENFEMHLKAKLNKIIKQNLFITSEFLINFQNQFPEIFIFFNIFMCFCSIFPAIDLINNRSQLTCF